MFTRTASAPRIEQATIASRKPAWLRQSRPIRSPSRIPLVAARARRELLGATQQEAVAHRPAVLVDHGGLVGVARLRGAQLGGEGEAVPAEGLELVEDSIRAARVQQAAARKRLADEQQVHGRDITSQ